MIAARSHGWFLNKKMRESTEDKEKESSRKILIALKNMQKPGAE